MQKNNIRTFLFAFFYLLICSYQQSCDIVIIGGTLASLGAAINAPDSYKTCLI
jgi:hypothetical protein